MSFLQIQQLSKKWQATTAVDAINIEIEQGEFIALLGPSGCGKSTTLRMIAGLEEPTSGTIMLEGNEITHLPPGKRQLSMVFQSYALFPHLSVKENILFGLKARSLNKEEQKKRLDSVVDLVNLKAQIDKKPGQLSGGQCQRVALARAIVSQAPICLMDEPLSNLDAKLRAEMRSEIRSLQKNLGLTVIYVTHDQIEAMSMADRIVLLNEGAIEQAGVPEALYNEPASTFVASFIGHLPMNLFTSQQHTIGVRPEHIRTHHNHDHIQVLPQHCRVVSAQVLNCDYQGVDTLVKVQLNDDLYNNETFKLSLEGLQRIEVGNTVYLDWPLDQQHYFDLQTGKRVNPSE
ncbi:MAG: sn-glycerol 3-phosphate transport system ATP-binding protein [Oceanospirillaceae bacterium]|jgi:sn-glycerol 3-phosphate transport system ATP-binding protein